MSVNIGLEELEELLFSLDSLTKAKILNDLAHRRSYNTDSFRVALYDTFELLAKYSSDIDVTKAMVVDIIDYLEGRFNEETGQKQQTDFWSYCPNCGENVTGTLIRYCPNCGIHLTEGPEQLYFSNDCVVDSE